MSIRLWRVPRSLVSMVAVALLAGLAPGPAFAASPLPACRYTDIATHHPAYSDWDLTLLDTIYRVPSSYVPPDLVSTSGAGVNGGHLVRSLLIRDLAAMSHDAHAAGSAFAVYSSYRSYQTQVEVYARKVEQYGEAEARRRSARPGHSEHQLGTAIDFRSAYSMLPPMSYDDYGQTKSGRFLGANAWKYGFVMSYPKSRRSVTCYIYEPWHFRYFGRERAAAIHDSGLTTREWLWREGGY
jgi:D-alanyl-D-alanine carboxypeptidase